MPFPKLSQLQSRFIASVAATLVLLLLYLAITRPQFAYAIEVESRIPQDHNHPIVLDQEFDEEGNSEESAVGGSEVKRAATILSLQNNAPQNMNIEIGATQYWVMTKDVIDGPAGESGVGLPGASISAQEDTHAEHELRRRQSEIQIYITLNTCIQPTANTTSSRHTAPPQLQMYYSQSDQNETPGPGSTGDQQQIEVNGGYGLINITAGSAVYIGVAAPNTTDYQNTWNYEIAASIDAPFHQYEADTPYLHFVDSDNHAALLITDPLTNAPSDSPTYQEWMSMPPPYSMFAHNQLRKSILGVENSFCGLQHNAGILANIEDVENQNVASMTNRALGQNSAEPKQQFYITTLNASATYWGFLAMQGNSTASGLNVVGGGGKVWAAMNFTTKAADNCALMYNLTFCDEVAYAVPTNPNLFSPRTGLPDLAATYDSYAAQMYQNFNYSLQQIPCNTTDSAQYSLARDCDDCAYAYKQWLCSVTIPRCEDYNNNATWLKPRNVAQPFINGTTINPQLGNNQQLLNAVATNQSRNAIIDEKIRPGPYKEVLPCEDVCYDIVRSCPAALGFGCPTRGAGFEDSYGVRSTDGGEITCSYMGAAYYLSGGNRIPRSGVATAGLFWALLLAAYMTL